MRDCIIDLVGCCNCHKARPYNTYLGTNLGPVGAEVGGGFRGPQNTFWVHVIVPPCMLCSHQRLQKFDSDGRLRKEPSQL